MSFDFPELPYSFDALEPHIDAKTMQTHYEKHHKGYHTKFMAAVEGTPQAEWTWEQIFGGVSSLSPAVRNNGGGLWNHTLFWRTMSPSGGGEPTGALAEAINAKWGSFSAFQEAWTTAATTLFGSGWTWLTKTSDGSLEIVQCPNQDNPMMDVSPTRGTPLLGLDLWEHAYYLNYQNRRPDYIKAWWNVVNWDEVAKNW